MWRTARRLHQTSDYFFASDFLKTAGIRLSVSFLDGMHLVEFLLRDFLNTEANSQEGGVILLHDFCPYTARMATRDHAALPDGAPWTGDVWKLLPILAQYRPDLRIDVLDCPPSGLVLVSGLAPGNRTLAENYEAILAQYLPLTLDSYGTERFFAQFPFRSASDFLANDGGYWAAIAQDSGAAFVPRAVSRLARVVRVALSTRAGPCSFRPARRLAPRAGRH